LPKTILISVVILQKKIVVLVLAFNLFLGGVGQMYKNAVFVLKNQYNY